VAAKTLARIEESIAMGTWRKLKDEFKRGIGNDLTINQLADLYYEGYCKVQNKRPDFKEHALKPIRSKLGRIPAGSLRRSDVHDFVRQRLKEVAPGTVNRSVGVLKNMLSFALENELIDQHPLIRFRMHREEPKAIRVLKISEERRLIDSIDDPTIASYVAILGETGLRKEEGLSLCWRHVNLTDRMLSVEYTKSGRPRYVPLSDFAMEHLASLVRLIDRPYVFVSLTTGDRWRNPRKPFEAGKRKAKLSWIGFHDLRHYRASQWVRQGVDLRAVQELLGHADIQTTMRYAHFALDHAIQRIRSVQRSEQESWEQEREISGRPTAQAKKG
jgi:integrase